MQADQRLTFATDGFLAPVPLFSAAECRRIAEYLSRNHPEPPDWHKARAVSERFLYDLAVHPKLLQLITGLLGEDVVLWGGSAVGRQAGEGHPCHTDIESARPEGGFVSVWIGVENTTRESAVQVISGSHRVGRTVQEERADRGMARAEGTAEAMLEAVRAHVPDALLVRPEVRDGDALVFDGRLWHASHNTTSRRRLALLFQYASANVPVRIPDLSQLDWPFRHLDEPLPPVILVAGSDASNVNRLVPAPSPPAPERPLVVTAVHEFDLPLATAEEFQSFFAFRGPTRTFAEMSCHASVLPAGETPHPPHIHSEEELLIPLVGDVDLVIAESPADPSPTVHRARPGSFAYYPTGQHHTIRNSGDSAVAYLMFKWRASGSGGDTPLATRIWDYSTIAAPPAARPFWTHRIFEAPTLWLRKLHAHLTVLKPGGGYEPHVDGYDVAIVLLSGVVETIGRTVEPLSVIYYAAGEPHGIRNVGTKEARYLVFEFHGAGVDALPAPMPWSLRTIRFAKRLARPLWKYVRPYVQPYRERRRRV